MKLDICGIGIWSAEGIDLIAKVTMIFPSVSIGPVGGGPWKKLEEAFRSGSKDQVEEAAKALVVAAGGEAKVEWNSSQRVHFKMPELVDRCEIGYNQPEWDDRFPAGSFWAHFGFRRYDYYVAGRMLSRLVFDCRAAAQHIWWQDTTNWAPSGMRTTPLYLLGRCMEALAEELAEKKAGAVQLV